MLMETIFRPELISRIQNNFGYKFIDGWDITPYDDHRFHILYDKIAAHRRDSYAPEEKFLIGYHDIDYHLNGAGLAIYNFNTIIQQLDIDPCRFVVLTTHYDSKQDWLRYCTSKNNQFHVIENFVCTRYWQSLQQIPQITTNCQHHFCCMIGISREHRDILTKFLVKRDLVNKNVMALNLQPGLTYYQPHKLENNRPPDQNHAHFSFVYTTPFNRSNGGWKYNDFIQNEILPVRLTLPYKNSKIDDTINQSTSRYRCEWYQDIFVDLVAETVFNYPRAFVTEKTLRPIVSGRPFIVAGAPRTLECLHKHGFKTFNKFWSEGYDQIVDPNDRLTTIMNLIDEISCWSMQQCQDLLEQMRPILEHNLNVYANLVEQTNLQ